MEATAPWNRIETSKTAERFTLDTISKQQQENNRQKKSTNTCCAFKEEERWATGPSFKQSLDLLGLDRRDDFYSGLYSVITPGKKSTHSVSKNLGSYKIQNCMPPKNTYTIISSFYGNGGILCVKFWREL